MGQGNKQDRREFLKKLGLGAATVIGASAFPQKVSSEDASFVLKEQASTDGIIKQCSCECLCTCNCLCDCGYNMFIRQSLMNDNYTTNFNLSIYNVLNYRGNRIFDQTP